ncbi:MAG: Uma2 family endonuclease, partial [Chloroflexota bacterium]
AFTVPDLVVEIISPSDRADRVLDKVHDWLRAGVQLLWYVDPDTGSTAVYQRDRVTYVTADEVLDGGDALPGFQIQLGAILRELREQFE